MLNSDLMTRFGQNGKTFGENETFTTLFDLSAIPFGDTKYKNFKAQNQWIRDHSERTATLEEVVSRVGN